MTRKLFYENAYLCEFEAKVTACEKAKEGYRVALDATAFYPEGGGQPADTGILGEVRVLDVHEREGEVWHTTDAPLDVGSTVCGRIDWQRRFSLMQQHTGEHIVSGLLHSLYGLNNVGFHMGREAITIDVDGEVGKEELKKVESLANGAVYQDIELIIDTPSSEKLKTIPYRSKKELEGEVRIVTVPGFDICACCGLHVKRTGELGVIKILSSQRYKGGVRLFMLCGDRAMENYIQEHESVLAISELLSAKPLAIAEAVRHLKEEYEAQRAQTATLRGRYFELKAQEFAEGSARAVAFEEGLDANDVRRYCLLLSGRSRFAAVLSGNDEAGCKYAAGSQSEDVRELGKALNTAFSGRGGGSKELVQGNLHGNRQEIEAFLSSWDF